MRQLLHKEIKNEIVKARLSILANNIHSPYNVGSLFRLADNLGFEKLYFSGISVYPPNNKITKTSRATEQFVDYEYQENPTQIIKKLMADNYKIISLEYCDNSIDIEQVKLKQNEKILLIIGEENRGITKELLALSDEVYHIKMYGKTTSMNVISACTIISYEILKQIR